MDTRVHELLNVFCGQSIAIKQVRGQFGLHIKHIILIVSQPVVDSSERSADDRFRASLNATNVAWRGTATVGPHSLALKIGSSRSRLLLLLCGTIA